MGTRPLVIIFGAIPHWVDVLSGDGDGDGDGYWVSIIASVVRAWTDKQRKSWERLLLDPSCFLALWKSDAKGLPANGGISNTPAAPGAVETISGPLKLCSNALHATLTPDKWNGDRLWVVALRGEIAIANDKVGALEREIIGEVILS